jgi:hypothetical protein
MIPSKDSVSHLMAIIAPKINLLLEMVHIAGLTMGINVQTKKIQAAVI